MPVNQGFGAHGEFGHGEHADDVTGFSTVGVTDSYPLLANDAAAILARLSRTDTLLPMTSESRVLAALLERVDALLPMTSEQATLFVALTALTDALAILANDAGAITTSFAATDDIAVTLDDDLQSPLTILLVRSDTLSIVLSEAVGIFTTVARSDALTTLLGEAVEIFASLTTRSDSYAVILSDAGVVVVSLANADTVTVETTEAVASPFPVFLSRSDQLKVITEHLVTGQDFGAHGEFAHGEHARDVGADPIVRELVEIFAMLARVDTLTPQVDAAALAVAVLNRIDTLLPKLTETDARAEERLHRRIVNVIQY